MELMEDEQLELMELAAASKGLPPIVNLDHATMQNLELFRGSFFIAITAELKEDITAEESFETKKCKLVELGIALLADPESNIKLLKEMLQMCNDHNHAIVKLGLLSLLAVFKDIIPGYRIRLPTEKELVMKVSKDVKKMRYYESTLLSAYKAYLQKLMVLEKVSLYQHAVVRCICTLLDAVPHFNYCESLVEVVVRNISSSDKVIRKLCCDTIKSLFTNEGKHSGEVTGAAARLIANYVKAHNCQMHPDSIQACSLFGQISTYLYLCHLTRTFIDLKHQIRIKKLKRRIIRKETDQRNQAIHN
ncbi:nucleolar complex protein 3 homolog [Eucalyptus grandis]|uniref:nucleolar complex protein 3 homolog n=1 Tax=Eucalyptus grandis TaxID=71139 RepID=UPI00192E9DE6|nr:nucleolar complex protein 3 homolog [Eucalyptus grandis]